mgnify:CR=1 FL=1
MKHPVERSCMGENRSIKMVARIMYVVSIGIRLSTHRSRGLFGLLIRFIHLCSSYRWHTKHLWTLAFKGNMINILNDIWSFILMKLHIIFILNHEFKRKNMLIKINCVCHNDNLAWKSIQSSIIERGNADYCNIITSSQMNILSHNTSNIIKNLIFISRIVLTYCEKKIF